MGLNRFDHVNICTANLDRMIAFYQDVLGMQNGDRPPFSIPGAWMYCGDQPVVHLVGVGEPPQTGEPRIEHFAFAATGLTSFLDKLDACGVPFQTGDVPGTTVVQVNIRDPDGNHIHIDFDRARE